MAVASACQRAPAPTLFALVGWFLLVLLTVYYVIINYGVWRKDHKIFTPSIKLLQPFKVWSLTARQYFVMFRQKQSPLPASWQVSRESSAQEKETRGLKWDQVLSHSPDTSYDRGLGPVHKMGMLPSAWRYSDYRGWYLWRGYPAIRTDTHEA